MNSTENLAIDQNICRTCLRDEELVGIYNNGEEISIFDGVSLAKMLNECTMYPVKSDDLFPKMICLKCVEDVKIAYNFRKQSESSYNSLKAFLINNDNYEADDDVDNDDDKGVITNIDAGLLSLPIVGEKTISEDDMPPTEKCIQTDEVTFYQCEKCDMKYLNYDLLRSHRVNEHKGSAHKCRSCSKVYKRISQLKRHMAAQHPEMGVQSTLYDLNCKICNKRYTRREHLKRHLQNYHFQINLVKREIGECLCTLCKKSFNNDTDYKNHKCEKENDKNSKKTSSTSGALIEPIIVESMRIEKLNEEKDYLMNVEDDNIQVNENHNVNETDFTNNNDNKDIKNDENDDKNDGNNDDNDYDGSNNDISDLNYDNDNHVNDDSTDEEDSIPLARLKIETAEKLTDNTKNLTEMNKSKSKKSPCKKEKRKTTKSFEKKLKTPKIHRCETCNKTFSRATHLRRHQKTHSDVKPYVCSVCGKGFTRIDHLNVHKLNHVEIKPFECDICNRGFVRSEHLKKHKESRHGDKKPNPKTEYCTICKRYFSSAKYLKTHIKSHADKRWTCKHCNKEFNVKYELTEHMKTHTNEKPFLCSECGLRFVRNDYLIIHMRRHKGEKPYKCRFCGKGFPRGTDLTVHERYHTGEKSHLCTICGKGFQRAYNLLVHNRVHTGERPYECPHCSKSFAQKNDLKAHIRRHTGERFKCDICGSGFIQGYHLTRHKLKVHGINVESHIRRVEKFVTPVEQQKQVEALQNKLKKSESLAETSKPLIGTTPTIVTTETATTTTATETKIPTEAKTLHVTPMAQTTKNNSLVVTATIPSSVQIFQIIEKLDIDDGDNKDILNDVAEVKIEKCDLDSNETIQNQVTSNPKSQLGQKPMQYVIIDDSIAAIQSNATF